MPQILELHFVEGTVEVVPHILERFEVFVVLQIKAEFVEVVQIISQERVWADW